MSARRNSSQGIASIAASVIVLGVAVLIFSQAAQAQTLTVLHNFTGGADGGGPVGLVIDRAGSLYGTTSLGGFMGSGCDGGCGTVFKLSQRNSSWIFSPLYSFQGGRDGTMPGAPVALGPNGSLYGTTTASGTQNGGTVFNLQPPLSACKTTLCPWLETVLYRFTGREGNGDGFSPSWGSLVFDRAGNIYGTTLAGGASDKGTVFQLAHSSGGWTESVLYSFTGQADGANPGGGLVLDSASNLYGTTYNGADEGGSAYELTPSGTGWIENTLHDFYPGPGQNPVAGMVFDQAGNLYGTTSERNTAFELSPLASGWMFATLYQFFALETPNRGALVFDAAGNLYGATANGGTYGYGTVYKLSPSSNGWTATELYSFTGGSDGRDPSSGVVLDANDNIYGTTGEGGTYGQGTVYEITP